jgi:hypothetical protein
MNEYRQKLLTDINIFIPESYLTAENWKNISEFSLSDQFLREFYDKIDLVGHLFHQEVNFPIMKNIISKTKHIKFKDIKKTHLSAKQIQEIEQMLELKHMFKKA